MISHVACLPSDFWSRRAPPGESEPWYHHRTVQMLSIPSPPITGFLCQGPGLEPGQVASILGQPKTSRKGPVDRGLLASVGGDHNLGRTVRCMASSLIAYPARALVMLPAEFSAGVILFTQRETLFALGSVDICQSPRILVGMWIFRMSLRRLAWLEHC